MRIDRGPVGTSAVVPAIAVSNSGTVAVTYYDFRRNPIGVPSLPTDVWAVTCTTNCTRTASWREQHLAGPFDARKVPATGAGLMLGDYSGLVPVGRSFVAVYGVGTGQAANPVDLYSTTFR